MDEKNLAAGQPDPSSGKVEAPASGLPRRRLWVTPTFERLNLSDAMAGVRNVGADLGCS